MLERAKHGLIHAKISQKSGKIQCFVDWAKEGALACVQAAFGLIVPAVLRRTEQLRAPDERCGVRTVGMQMPTVFLYQLCGS